MCRVRFPWTTESNCPSDDATSPCGETVDLLDAVPSPADVYKRQGMGYGNDENDLVFLFIDHGIGKLRQHASSGVLCVDGIELG